MSRLSFPFTPSTLENEISELQVTRPCFCCQIRFTSFFIFYNAVQFATPAVLGGVFIFLLARGSLLIASIIGVVLCLIHFSLSGVSLLVYMRSNDIATVVQKWQGICMLFLACLYMTLFIVYFFLLCLVSLGQITLSESIVVIDLYMSLLVLLPVLSFNLYWTLLFMQMVAVQFQINKIIQEGEGSVRSVNKKQSDFGDISIDVS